MWLFPVETKSAWLKNTLVRFFQVDVFSLGFCHVISDKNTDSQMSPTVGRYPHKYLLCADFLPQQSVIFELKTSATKSIGFEGWS